MKIRIYQINSERDREKNNILFQDYNEDTFSWDVYDIVYDGEINAVNLENIFFLFNYENREDKFIRSLSVSDIIEIVDGNEEVDPGFYYCQDIGFIKLDEKKFNEEDISMIKEALFYAIEQAEYIISVGDYSSEHEKEYTDLISKWKNLLERLNEK